MAKQTGWIHGGKYVKPNNNEKNVHHRFAAASSPRRSSKQRTHSNSTTLSTLWTFTLKLLTSHVLPLIITIIQTMIALAAMTIGAVVCAVQLVRMKLMASKHRQCQSPMQQQQQQQRDNRNSSGSVDAAPPRENHTTEATSSSQITPPIQSRSTNQTSSALQSTTAATATMPSSSKTTPKSLLRTTTKKSSSSSRRTSFGSKEPRTARRVLFFETSEGKVSRTEVLYDKEMPASARKDVTMSGYCHSKDGRGGLLLNEAGVLGGATAMNTTVTAGSSYSPNASLGGGDSTSSTSVEKLKNDDNTNYSIYQQASNNRSPMATTLVHQHTLNKITVPLNNNNNNSNNKQSSSSSIPPPIHNSKSTSPLATLTNKRPRDETNTTTTAVRDVISKRRNLIAVSRYNSKQPYPKTRPVYNNTNGSNNMYITKRRREEIIWNVMNKKNKYDAVENNEENTNTGKEGLLLRDTDTTIALGKTPMKARPTN